MDEIPYWRDGTLEKYSPSGDYVVVKFARWAFEKFENLEDKLGTQMQAVGEVMSIGKNYKEAIKLLEGKNGFEHKVAYQKVAFYRGIELYNDGNYLEAESFFDKSLKEPRNKIYTARATFWKAEVDYNLTNYDDALIGFKQFQQQSASNALSENSNLDYNLAYTYFKQKNYQKATQYFNQFIANHKEDKVRLNDAYLRLGDGHFVSSDYSNAINAYNEAIKIERSHMGRSQLLLSCFV